MPQIAGQGVLVPNVLCALVVATAFGAVRSEAAEPGTASGAYASAKTCQSCHRTIHLYWSESEHGRSAVKPSYLEALRTAVDGAVDPNRVRRDCVSCHAPTALVTGDFELKQSLTREGVSCDFCHTVADVDLDKADHPFDLRPGRVKRGPLEYAKSPSHGMAYSPLHKSSSLLCAACHEYKNALGVRVLSTYTEWKDGPYPARGMNCQECHMPLVPGDSVREGLPSTRRVINLHRMTGGSAASQIDKGLALRIESLTVGAATADVHVVVTNAAAGHAVPGGLSTKTLLLAVGVETASGELLHRQERAYRRELKDAEGRTLVRVPDLFLKAASVGEDSRLKPRESRTERFTIPIPEGARAIVARLEYRDASDPSAPPKTTVITEQRRVPRSGEP